MSLRNNFSSFIKRRTRVLQMAHSLRRNFLCLFAQEHPHFRLPELLSIISMLHVDVTLIQVDYSVKRPFLVLTAASINDVLQIAERSVLIKYVYELFGMATSYGDLKLTLQNLPLSVMEPYTKTDYTFSVRVKAFNKKISLDYQRDAIEWLSFLPIGGTVNLKNPLHEFHLLEDYGDNPNMAPPTPKRVYFCKLLGCGQRHLINQYSLKSRYFIGNTSMDAQLSLIMANMARVSSGSLVYDPFAGTGSILVACAHYGGYVIGSDIDWTIVHGRGRSSRSTSQNQWRARDENVRSNLVQYSLDDRYIDMLVHDASCCIWSGHDIFDAIITDPPYGIREGLRKTNEDSQSIQTGYSLSGVFSDLLGFAARFLVLGGRLVYWLPHIEQHFDPNLIPSHPSLSLISTCEQSLSSTVSRRLITMEKSSTTHPSMVTNKLNMTHFDSFREKYFKH